MKAASNLLLKFSQKLFAKAPDQRQQFLQALTQPQGFAATILWCRSKPATLPFAIAPPLPWQPAFVDRLTSETKPGQYSLHTEGYYYCLDFSSVFAASPLQILPQFASSPLVLDLCAAPGGKGIFAWKALQPQFLFSNEVIGKRLGMLISNLKRCHIEPAAVLSLDSQVLAQLIPARIQVVLVDAPCTGQSLLAKGEKAPGCFHPVTINQNANRQKRILANASYLVAPQGFLLYMTCAFSPEENEQVSAWFLQKFPQFQPVAVPHLTAFQSHLTDHPCYRLWPQSGLGAGAFTILFQNRAEGETSPLPVDFLAQPGVKWRSPS